MLLRLEHERQRRNDGFRHDVVEGGDVDADHVERAELHLLDRVLLRAERAVAEHLDGVFAAGLSAMISLIFDRHHGRIIVRMDVGGAELLRAAAPDIAAKRCGTASAPRPPRTSHVFPINSSLTDNHRSEPACTSHLLSYNMGQRFRQQQTAQKLRFRSPSCPTKALFMLKFPGKLAFYFLSISFWRPHRTCQTSRTLSYKKIDDRVIDDRVNVEAH